MATPLTPKAAAARYRALFQSAADPILVADGNGHYLDANPAALSLLGLVATPSLFSTLRVSPVLGRAFSEDEALPGNDKSVILRYSLWVNRFNGDPAIVDSEIRLRDAPSTLSEGEAKKLSVKGTAMKAKIWAS